MTRRATWVSKSSVISQLQDETLKEEHLLTLFPVAFPDLLPGAV